MSTPAVTKLKAVAWLVLSPVAVLMALMSTVESPTVYYAQIFVFGFWSVLGMFSGLGSLLRTHWASRIQKGLVFVAVAYFSLAGIGIVGFLASALLNGGVADPVQGWVLTGLVLLLVLAVMARARVKRMHGAPTHEDA